MVGLIIARIMPFSVSTESYFLLRTKDPTGCFFLFLEIYKKNFLILRRGDE